MAQLENMSSAVRAMPGRTTVPEMPSRPRCRRQWSRGNGALKLAQAGSHWATTCYGTDQLQIRRQARTLGFDHNIDMPSGTGRPTEGGSRILEERSDPLVVKWRMSRQSVVLMVSPSSNHILSGRRSNTNKDNKILLPKWQEKIVLFSSRQISSTLACRSPACWYRAKQTPYPPSPPETNTNTAAIDPRSPIRCVNGQAPSPLRTKHAVSYKRARVAHTPFPLAVPSPKVAPSCLSFRH